MYSINYPNSSAFIGGRQGRDAYAVGESTAPLRERKASQ